MSRREVDLTEAERLVVEIGISSLRREAACYVFTLRDGRTLTLLPGERDAWDPPDNIVDGWVLA